MIRLIDVVRSSIEWNTIKVVSSLDCFTVPLRTYKVLATGLVIVTYL